MPPEMPSCRIAIRLTPKAAREAIQGWAKDVSGGDILKCSVTAVPENGKANEALIVLLSKKLKTPKSAIFLIRGATDRNKIIEIQGLDENALRNIIEASY